MASFAVPDIDPPPQAVRDHVRQWYEDHEQTYVRVWSRLDEMREHYALQDDRGKKALLKLSYMNSVMSVQTPLYIHEEWFNRVVAGEGLEEAWDAAGAGLPMRIPAMRETLADYSLWDELVELLGMGDVDTAHKLLIDNAQWVSTAKAPFTLANLGFVEKMCIDSNVAKLMGMFRTPETKVVEKYEGLCADIRALFPDLAEILEPYELQWLIFDYQRFYQAGRKGGNVASTREQGMAVAQHAIWFETALGNVDRIAARMDAIPFQTNGENPWAEIDEAFEDDLRELIQQEIDAGVFSPAETVAVIEDEIDAAITGD